MLHTFLFGEKMPGFFLREQFNALECKAVNGAALNYPNVFVNYSKHEKTSEQITHEIQRLYRPEKARRKGSQ